MRGDANTPGVGRAGEDAQAMVEFSMGALALFTILFALMTFGYTFGKRLDLQGANRAAARRAAVAWDDATAGSKAHQALADQLTLTRESDVSFSIDPPPPWAHGQQITVTSRTPHSFGILGVTAWSGTLKAKTRIRVE
jgi:hypothetical protein